MDTPLKDIRFRRSATDEGETEMGGSGGFAPMSGPRPQRSQFYEASQSTHQRASAQSASGGGGGGDDDDDDPGRRRGGGGRGRGEAALELDLNEFKLAIAQGFRMAQSDDFEAELIRQNPEINDPPRSLSDFIERMYDPDVSVSQKRQDLVKQFDDLGAQYIQYPNESNRDIVQRLDFIKKIKLQNEAYAALKSGEPIKLEKGFMQTSDFSQEKILSTAVNGSPTSKIIRFTNGISEVKIVPDGNGQYFGVQSGKRFGPGKYPDIERWAQRGGFEANEKRELKNIMDAIKDPEKMKAVVFRARKL
jgi:hypothetical protein